MRAELPVLSFLSLFCLVLILPGQLKSNTIPAVSIISWLFVCNSIHGVNSLVWAGNTGIHVPVWCDIVTKVLLGAMVAVPGAFLCICRHIEFATSRPRDATSIPTQRQKILFEVSMCILSPVLYMALHTIVQDHRFTILEDFGCQPALYDYMPSLLIVWLPPLIISLVSLLYCVSALINVLKSRYNNWPCFPQASKMTLGLFARRFAFAATGMLYVFVVYAFIVSWASSNLEPEISVSQLHANFSQIEILPLDAQARVRVELVWWAVPVWSLLLCALSSEETRNGYQAIFGWVFKHRDHFDLPMHTKAEFISVTPTSSVHLLRPAWFDSVKSVKSPSASMETDHTDHVTFAHPSLSMRSPDSSPPVSPGQDASFAQSTLSYLDSDAARQLRLPSPPLTAHPYGLTSRPPAEKQSADKLTPCHAARLRPPLRTPFFLFLSGRNPRA
ncbi:hypothetical protein EWM64_g1593 [Hericium alpestre]|uniref:Uncharacterized protein n=1 Tax=Hericium alpestre TaxID=135208 RepID=A0A4Z0A921_9AGAM|nr:hypothetical protein EWM64_g1593 [Hericium alpestre]